MTVVERSEWVPSGRVEMSLDELTGTRVAVFYAKVPLTAADTDGVLLRHVLQLCIRALDLVLTF